MFSIRGPNAMHVDASSRGATFNLVAACRLPRAQEGMPPAKKAKEAGTTMKTRKIKKTKKARKIKKTKRTKKRRTREHSKTSSKH